ncbi:MAG: EscJ/YscJ/HrcJ family type III secretion inner membrane ring protein [Waddliaceae bacterium]|nr:EscJ/YscJ/HrcJ family type III secretion inner membrane ring protein [Waddliaceae bacterium]
MNRGKSISQFLLGILLLCFLSGCASQQTIVHDLTEREANEIVVFLTSKDIGASKMRATEATGGGGSKVVLWDIQVPQVRATEAMAILNQNGLPRKPGQTLLNLFTAGSLVPSEKEELIRFENGLAEQIASTIRKIDGIIDADVQLSIPKEDILNPGAAPTGKTTASVFIKHQGVLDDPNSHLVTKIKRHVANSVQGLDYDDVTVIPHRARFLVPLEQLSGAHGGEREYVRVWSIVVAKDSLTRFRVLVFSMSSIILFASLSLMWMTWKVFPVLFGSGGWKQLLSLEQIGSVPEAPPKDEKKSSKDKKKTSPPSDEDEEEEEDEDLFEDDEDDEDEEEASR